MTQRHSVSDPLYWLLLILIVGGEICLNKQGRQTLRRAGWRVRAGETI
jgi:hypothetical protein